MSKKFPGFYLYYDWAEALEDLPAKKAMAIITNMKNYLRDGIEPTPLDGQAGTLQFVIMAQLKRSKVNSENGSRGGAPSHKKSCEETKKATSANPPLHFLTEEEVQNMAYTDYLKLKRRFDEEAKALANDPEWLEIQRLRADSPPRRGDLV